MWQLSNPEILQASTGLREDICSGNVFFNQLQEHDLIETWMYTSWLLWNNRNNYFHNNSFRIPSAIVCAARRMLMDFQEASANISVAVQATPIAWSPPNRDFLKLNADAL